MFIVLVAVVSFRLLKSFSFDGFSVLVRRERYELPNDFSGCVLRKLDCPSSFVLLETSLAPSLCAVLTCNGTEFNGTQISVPRVGDWCSVVRPSCGSNCTDWVRICDSASGPCEWKRKPCIDGCTIPNTAKEICNCPLDFLGSRCQTPRTFSCRFLLKSPAPQCERIDESDQDMVDVDPVCHRYKLAEGVEEVFRYRLDCAFTNLTGLPVPFPGDDGFRYAVQVNSTWALSSSTFESIWWRARLKVFNWKILSDTSLAMDVNMTELELSGEGDLEFVLDMKRLRSQHLIGGRMYAEVGFHPDTATAVSKYGLAKTTRKDRLFVDFVDLADLTLYPPALGPKPTVLPRGRSQGDTEENNVRVMIQTVLWTAFAVTMGLIFLLTTMKSFKT